MEGLVNYFQGLPVETHKKGKSIPLENGQLRIVREGFVFPCTMSSDGQVRILGVGGPNIILGSEAFNTAVQYENPTGAIAATYCETMKLSARTFRYLFTGEDITFRLWAFQQLAEQQRLANQVIRIGSFRGALRAAMMVDLLIGEMAPDSRPPITLPIDQKTFGQMAGLTRETANIVLGELSDQTGGAVVPRRRVLLVVDPEGLRQYISRRPANRRVPDSKKEEAVLVSV